jgi:hypothetical protein
MTHGLLFLVLVEMTHQVVGAHFRPMGKPVDGLFLGGGWARTGEVELGAVAGGDKGLLRSVAAQHLAQF